MLVPFRIVGAYLAAPSYAALSRVFIDIRDPSPAALTCGDVELSPSHVNGRRRLRVELGRSLELLRDAEQLAPPKHT
jgi:hypothetical protein